jgi:siroheme synthase-like protein
VPEKNNLYPVFLKLEELRLLLVGGGNVALEKLTSVLSNSPATAVTIVAPVIRDEVKEFISSYPRCEMMERSFEEADLENKGIVICATDNKELHRQIKLLANKKGLLVNVADTPELCDFYLGSIVQKGNLKIAVSTNGKSPTIAKRVKETIHEMIPDEMEEVLNNMQAIRNSMIVNFEEKVKRLNEITRTLASNSLKDEPDA